MLTRQYLTTLQVAETLYLTHGKRIIKKDSNFDSLFMASKRHHAT